MFESDLASDEPRVAPHPAIARRSSLRPVKWGVLLATLLTATFLVWGFVENVREAADRTN